MKSPSFLHGAGLALVLSIAGSALFALLTQLTDTEAALRLLVSGVAAAYLLVLLRGSSVRVGKVTTVLAFTAISGLSWIFQADLPLYLLIHMGLLWLVRSLFFYRSLLAAALDLGLQGLSLAAAFWALQETGSLLLSLWSFFLMQALFVAIPPTGFSPVQSEQDCTVQKSGFQKAHRSAEAALRRLY